MIGPMAEAKPVDNTPRERTAVPSPATKTFFANRPWLLTLVLAVVTFAAYQPTWHAGFVWDDDSHLTENLSLRSVDGLRRIWTKPGDSVQQYYPLTFTGFWAEYHLCGRQPFGYHLVNVLLHALNAILLWRVLRRLEVPGAWWAAAIFALHPVEVESAAWITELKNVFSGMFSLLSVSAFLRFRPLAAAEPPAHGDWRFYPVATLLFIGALLSKTAVCCLPVAILVLIWWKQNRITKRDVLALIPWFAASLTLGLITVRVEHNPANASVTSLPLSIVQRCLLAGRVLWFYAGKLFWPRQFTFVYPRWEIDAGAPWQYLFPVAALAVVIALWCLRRRIGRGPLVAVLCFAVMLSPVLGFCGVYYFRYSYVADHFQYLACIGLIALVASLWARVCELTGRLGRYLDVVAVPATLMILGVLTWRQAGAYRDVETLWRDTLAKNPAAWMAHNNLGVVLRQAGKFDEAIGQYEQALRIKPDFAEAHNNLGNALKQAGKIEEAIAHYEQALRIKPDYAEAQYNLGVALVGLGRLQEAMGHWEQALRSKPDYAEAENNLAWLLATLAPADGGDPVRAVTLAERACELTNNRVAEYLDTLAVAYAAAGRFNDATATAQNAIGLARSAGQTQIVSEIETRLELYRAGRPYHQSVEVTSPGNP